MPEDHSAVIELRVRELNQLFNPLDHSPFREQDLLPTVEQYIVESAEELRPRVPLALLVHLDQRGDSGAESAIETAVHAHFARSAAHHLRRRRDLLRQGRISLGIGMLFLVGVFLLGQAVSRMLGQGTWPTLLRESLLIGGWVAMWRPLEIFLYDWWPIEGERRRHLRLSRMRVHIAP